MVKKRGFGSVRKLPSGKWQARYTDPVTGGTVAAPTTFAVKREADDWLAEIAVGMRHGTWRSPAKARETLGDFMRSWVASRSDLAATSLEIYDRSNRIYVSADLDGINLGGTELGDISAALGRAWFKAASAKAFALAEAKHVAAYRARAGHPARAWAAAHGVPCAVTGTVPKAVMAGWEAAGRPPAPVPPMPRSREGCAAGAVTVAQAYRCVVAAMNQAVKDGLIVSNPISIPGAGTPHASERVPATAEEVAALASAMPSRLSAAVHMAAWTSLRAGELFALRPMDVDLRTGAVRVAAQVIADGTFTATKTRNRRTVYMPAPVLEMLIEHLSRFPRNDHDLIFVTATGQAVRSWHRSKVFDRARRAIGRPDLTWHDLRHTGAIFATQSGATLAEVQNRLGHTTVTAAMRYQHAAEERDRLLAERMGEAIRAGGNVIPLRASHG